MVRFIHTSDWQLGMTRHYLPPEAQARFTGERIEAIRRIGKLAQTVGAQFVVVAGDVFEHSNLPAAVVARAAGAIGEVQVPVYLLPGNHDHVGAGNIWEQDAWLRNKPANAFVLDTPGIHQVNDEVELLAAPWVGKHPETDPVGSVLAGLAPAKKLRILVGHGMLDGVTFSDPEDSSKVLPSQLHDALAADLIHYVALGDRHIAWSDDPTGRIHYSGTHETTSFNEPDRGTLLEVDLSRTDVKVTKHEIGKWLHKRINRNISSDADLVQFEAELAGISNKENTIIKYSLTGELNLAQAARLDELLDSYGKIFASLTQWDRHTDIAVVPSETDLSELPVGGYVRTAAEELAEKAAAGDAAASDALKLLHRFVGGLK